MRDDIPADLATAIALSGEMGRRFADYDWASHPLGPLRDWSPEVRATVAVGLTSRVPIVLWLGAGELFLVYNDAYIPVLGDRHPGALGAPGRRVWWDIWDSIGPMLTGVVATGKATWSDDLLLSLVSAGHPTQRYFTFGYSPIITAKGEVDGIFCAVTETTERVLGERRVHVLTAVAAASVETRTIEEAIQAIVDACAVPHPDLPFTAVYVDDFATGSTRLRAATPNVSGLLPPTLDALLPSRVSSPHVVTGLDERLPALTGAFDECPKEALVIPAAAHGEDGIGGALVIGLNPRRPLDVPYRAFCRLLADQMSVAFATAGSHERQRRRADALAELDRVKTTFLANVSHEFRTPLTLLLGPVEDAIAAAGGEPAQLERLEVIRRNAKRLQRLVDSLLEFSRAEAGRATAAVRRVDVGALTAQIASSFAELCRRAGLRLDVRCAPAIGDVDPQMWETIMLNLLSNAVKFTLAGSITVEVGTGPDGITLRVADTGSGIAEKDLGHLFERFYRADDTNGRSVEGSGIGLSLVHSLVGLHRGTIRVESAPGAGTAVIIDLPAAPDDTTPAGVPALRNTENPYVAEALQWLDRTGLDVVLPGPAAGRGARQLVLVVDDNADMRRMVHGILSAHWDTVLFADGLSALDGIRRHRPDVVVTDVMLPGLDGLGLVSALRADPELASIPVLMLSARAGSEATGEGLSGGADDYLPKPFLSAELVARVRARLAAGSRQREAVEHDSEQARHATATADLGAAMANTASIDDVLAALLESPLAALDATAAVAGLLDEGLVRITSAGDVPGELRDRYLRVGLDTPLPIAEVLRTGEPMVLTGTKEIAASYGGILRDAAMLLRAVVLHPLRDDFGVVVGALLLLWRRPRRFTRAELDEIGAAAATTAAAVCRVRAAEREHLIALGFQEHLLDLDRTSGAAVVAARYEPAAEAMRVGGDWYLTTPLDDAARIGVSVGDVVGHGLPAATVMSRLRAATTAAALTEADPRSVLDVLERCAAGTPGALCATVAYAVVDSETRTVGYACAGHPYPLLVGPEGTTRYLEDGRRPPLAVAPQPTSRPAAMAGFGPGSMLLLYTDGLVERSTESIDDGFARLAEAAASCGRMATGTACDEILRLMAPLAGYTDDVVLLAIRPIGTTADSMVVSVPAKPRELGPLRRRLRAWLSEPVTDQEAVRDIVLSVSEAAANAIEHCSSANRATTISVEAFADPGAIKVTVSDTGHWQAGSSTSSRGASRGLAIINGLADHVTTVRRNSGTRVTLSFNRPHR